MALYDINGNALTSGGSGNSYFEEKTTFVSHMYLPKMSEVYIENINGWVWNYYSGANRFVYTNELLPSGTYYFRTLTNTHAVSNAYADVRLVTNANWFTDKDETPVTLSPEWHYTAFWIEGKWRNIGVMEDGTYGLGTRTNSAVDGAVGYVNLSKFVIPDGYYGVITSLPKGTSANKNVWVDKYMAVFGYDISEDILTMPTTQYDKVLTLPEEYKMGFARELVNDSYFRKFFRDNFEGFVKNTVFGSTYGKSIVLKGDSIIANAGGYGFASNGFLTDMNQYLGFKTVNNGTFAGSTWSGTGSGSGIYEATALTSQTSEVYDIIILEWGGNNDPGGLGTIDDEPSNAEGGTLAASMKWVINTLRNHFTLSAIGVVIPGPKTTDTTINETADLMIQICIALHIPYIDMRLHTYMEDTDGSRSHLNEGGKQKYGGALSSFIESICPVSYTLKTIPVTYNLTGCSIDRTETEWGMGIPFVATITPEDGKTLSSVTFTSRGNDYTSLYYEDGVINAKGQAILGDIVITAIAE